MNDREARTVPVIEKGRLIFMLACMTSAIAGLKANMTGLNVVGNNISNVNTNSFKSSSSTFRDAMYQELTSGSAGNASEAGINPSQIGYGATASTISVNNTKGSPNVTGKSSDVYIDGDGYFIVGNGTGAASTVDGSTDKEATYTFDGYKYTRIGTLGFDSNGYLTDGDGNYVMGYLNTNMNYDPKASPPDPTVKIITPDDPDPDKAKTAVLKAIREPATKDKSKPDPVRDLAIASDGTVTCTDNGVTRTLGKIALAKFTNPDGMKQAGGGFFTTTANAGTETHTTPSSGGTGGLITGELEASNVDIATEFSNMITYERGYEANTKIVGVADEMLQTLVNMK